MAQLIPMESEALNRYRDLIQQGESPACAKARVQIEFGIILSSTWQALAERGPLATETW